MRILLFVLSLSLASCTKSFKPQEPIEVSNGHLTLLFLPDPELPVVNGAVYIPGGSLWERVPGSTEMMGSLLAAGGTRDLSPQEFERKLKSLAGQISSKFGEEYGTVAFSSLSAEFDEVFGLFVSVLTEPAFDRGRFELLKRQSLDDIRRRKDSPDTVARIILKSALFGDSPFGRSLTSAQVKAISHESIIERYNDLVTPNKAYLVITGDITLEKAKDATSKLESRWQRSADKDLTAPSVEKPVPGVYFVEMDTKQASVFVGEHSIPRGHPDRFKIEVLNNILGFGGFGSRLMQSVRSKSGLAYSVYGGTIPGLTVGTNIIAFQTKNESVGEALRLSFGEVDRLKEELVGEEELRRNQDSLINSFVFRFETAEATLTRKAAQRMLRVADSFDRDYFEAIPRVKASDVRDMAKKWWNLDRAVIAVVGNRSALESIKNEFPQLPIFEGSFDEVFYLK